MENELGSFPIFGSLFPGPQQKGQACGINTEENSLFPLIPRLSGHFFQSTSI